MLHGTHSYANAFATAIVECPMLGGTLSAVVLLAGGGQLTYLPATHYTSKALFRFM